MPKSLREVSYLGGMVALAAMGFFLAFLPQSQDFLKSEHYPYVLNGLLGIGLYASVAGIDLRIIQSDVATVFRVITIGVVAKTAIIALLVYQVSHSWTALVFAVIVAQIDPLSVSALTNRQSGRLGERAKTLLLAWASFDDPITVIMSLVLAAFLFSHTTQPHELLFQIGNLLLPAMAFLLHLSFRGSRFLQAILFLLLFAISVYFGWMLAIAIAGLFLRPFAETHTALAVRVAFVLSLLLVGLNLEFPINVALAGSIALGAVFSQILVTIALAWNLGNRERWFLCFAQQNGITALILSLYFAPLLPSVVPTIAAAVFMINAVHLAAFPLLDRVLANPKK